MGKSTGNPIDSSPMTKKPMMKLPIMLMGKSIKIAPPVKPFVSSVNSVPSVVRQAVQLDLSHATVPGLEHEAPKAFSRKLRSVSPM
eukprot:4010706-Ditylum_brightwellii.AAC.1